MPKSLIPLLVVCLIASVAAVRAGEPLVPPSPEVLPVEATEAEALAKIEPSLLFTSGPVDVLVQMADAPLIVALGPGAKQTGGALNPKQQRLYMTALRSKQQPVVGLMRSAGGEEIMQLTKSLNGVLVRIEAEELPDVARLKAVTAIRAVPDLSLDLSVTVPQVGANIVRGLGYDGRGVRVAVIDTGIDYTHANLGGPGTLAAYEAAWGTTFDDARNTQRDGLFPTAKVVEGWDYVGEAWSNGGDAMEPDEDPIDRSSHGTHVADIIAGKQGMAPGATLYAFKACSARSMVCGGTAILQALEACLNPDDPMGRNSGVDLNPVDIVNLSFGVAYGQIQSPAVFAVSNLVNFGVVVVCSSGNSGDKPYVVGAPGMTPQAISVAETTTGDAIGIRFLYQEGTQAWATVTAINTVPWAPVVTDVKAPIVDVGGPGVPPLPGTGCPGTDYPTPVAGKIALIYRGDCDVSVKVDRAARAGAVGVIIGNNEAGASPSFTQGGGSQFVPTIVVEQQVFMALRARLQVGSTVVGRFNRLSLASSAIASSSRGPSFGIQALKPDLAAPGASVSAIAGSGTGVGSFGGSSGSAPMVSGASALLLDAMPTLLPHELKARLMNNADPNLWLDPIGQPGVLAPLTKVGAGEIRVHKALQARTMAWDKDSKIPSLSFGYGAFSQAGAPHRLKRTLEIRNMGNGPVTYNVAGLFRYAANQRSAALRFSFQPASLTIPKDGSGFVEVVLTVDPTKLPAWTLNGGLEGGNGELLRQLEYSGTIVVSGSGQSVRVPWHLLPRRAAELAAQSTPITLSGPDPTMHISNNKGAIGAWCEIFDLVGTSPQRPWPQGGLGDGYVINDLKALGVRAISLAEPGYPGPFTPDLIALQFAISTYQEWTHPNYPGYFEVLLDLDDNGFIDHILFNSELGASFGASGQNVTFLYKAATGERIATFYTDADLNASAAILTVKLSTLGLTIDDLFRPLPFMVQAYGSYFDTIFWDWIDANGTAPGPDVALEFIQHTVLDPRYVVIGDETIQQPEVYVAPGGQVDLPIIEWGSAATSPSQKGFLLLHRQAKPGRWAQEVQVRP